MKEKYRRNPNPANESVFIEDWSQATDALAGILHNIHEGTTKVTFLCRGEKRHFTVQYKRNRILGITDEDAYLDVMLIEKMFNLPPYYNHSAKQLARSLETSHVEVLRKGIVTTEIQTYRGGMRVTPLSARKLYIKAIKKIDTTSSIGGVFSLWEDGQLDTIYREYWEKYEQLKCLEEIERRKQAAKLTRTGNLLTSICCHPEFIHHGGDFVAALFVKK